MAKTAALDARKRAMQAVATRKAARLEEEKKRKEAEAEQDRQVLAATMRFYGAQEAREKALAAATAADVDAVAAIAELEQAGLTAEEIAATLGVDDSEIKALRKRAAAAPAQPVQDSLDGQ